MIKVFANANNELISFNLKFDFRIDSIENVVLTTVLMNLDVQKEFKVVCQCVLSQFSMFAKIFFYFVLLFVSLYK